MGRTLCAEQSQPLSWYETKRGHCVKSKTRFLGSGHGDKTAVQLMSDHDSLPAVCNCCSTLPKPDSREEEEKDPGPRSAGSCLMILNNLCVLLATPGTTPPECKGAHITQKHTHGCAHRRTVICFPRQTLTQEPLSVSAQWGLDIVSFGERQHTQIKTPLTTDTSAWKDTQYHYILNLNGQ